MVMHLHSCKWKQKELGLGGDSGWSAGKLGAMQCELEGSLLFPVSGALEEPCWEF